MKQCKCMVILMDTLQFQRPFFFNGLSEKTIILVLRGSGYLGYVDSNRGYNPYKWVICPQILGL